MSVEQYESLRSQALAAEPLVERIDNLPVRTKCACLREISAWSSEMSFSAVRPSEISWVSQTTTRSGCAGSFTTRKVWIRVLPAAIAVSTADVVRNPPFYRQTGGGVETQRRTAS